MLFFDQNIGDYYLSILLYKQNFLVYYKTNTL